VWECKGLCSLQCGSGKPPLSGPPREPDVETDVSGNFTVLSGRFFVISIKTMRQVMRRAPPHERRQFRFFQHLALWKDIAGLLCFNTFIHFIALESRPSLAHHAYGYLSPAPEDASPANLRFAGLFDTFIHFIGVEAFTGASLLPNPLSIQLMAKVICDPIID
jgi:hypothetical protein